MINVILGIFYVALIALISYILYFIIKTAIKDAYYDIYIRNENEEENKTNYLDNDLKE